MRFLLALQLKNALYSRDDSLKTAYQERWLQMPDEARAHIKNNVGPTEDLQSYRSLSLRLFV